MTVFSATKAHHSPPSMLFVPLCGFTCECPRAENVTFRARDVTP